MHFVKIFYVNCSRLQYRSRLAPILLPEFRFVPLPMLKVGAGISWGLGGHHNIHAFLPGS